ncbi:hypothetical protein HNI00_11400 [Thermoleptolyngbya oregonensis NK1-22]|uniref:Uncharacterized protein n=1 Tax=Thermoleptolyngbya oregonensis NK1-22 TaxID=2547457 RepID=A0AA97BD60_9CYAN|nr:hypothetical protein [Thermoleptolyngbya oregonensis]WOB43691.1 hypothetical protein HNI00_11400 [Thermoleptolyngbya oregonensis NK1-22]
MNTIHKPGDLEPKPGSATSLAIDGSCSRRSRWARLWDGLLDHLLSPLLSYAGDPGEPRVWFERDRNGESWWCAHDPVTGDRVRCHTGTELRAWLESRYNRPSSRSTHTARSIVPPIHRW